MRAELDPKQRREVRSQVARFLGRSDAFAQLPEDRKREVLNDTGKIVEKLAQGASLGGPDPYATELGTVGAGSSGSWVNTDNDKIEGRMTGNVKELLKNKGNEIGSVIGAGVTQAARMVKEIDFPTFVASLIEGTFHAIVKSSIEQMQAYAEMVKSVSSTLNDFRDQSTTDNQARDHLVQRYPQHFQLTVINGQPRVGVRDGADDLPVPNFKLELGAQKDITSLDDDMVEEQLVPLARDDLARSRQQLLATIIMMGINRIVVTDGKINAKLRFQFQANERQTTTATAYDYVKTGNVYANEGSYEGNYEYQGSQSSYSKDNGGSWQGPSSTSYSKGNYKSSVTPDVRVTSQVDTSSTGSLQASGQIMGEVSINFKSETFPLEKMIDSSQMMNLQNAQAGGRAPAQLPRGQGPAPAATTPQNPTQQPNPQQPNPQQPNPQRPNP